MHAFNFIKCCSKKELCTVLMNDWSVFIIIIQDANAAYVRGVVLDLPSFSVYINFKLSWSVCGTKDTKIIQFSLINGLITEEILMFYLRMLTFTSTHQNIGKLYSQTFNGNELGIKLIDIFITHALIGSKFKEWKDEIMDKREKGIVLKKSFTVQVLSEFSKTFKFSKSES